MTQGTGGRLPDELALIPPGPELAAILADVDMSTLEDLDLVRYAQARQRLLAHDNARLLSTLHELGRRGDQIIGGNPEHRWAQIEIAYAMTWTPTTAAGQLTLADDLLQRLPAVFTALDQGEIDIPKARIMSDLTMCLATPTARQVIDKIIDQAPRLTTGQLRARLATLVFAADPQAKTTRVKKALTGRRVQVRPTNDGLAELHGQDLPPHRTAAAMERLTAIARTAKHHGDTRTMTQLRADILLDLLVGEGIATGGPITDCPLADPTPTTPPTRATATPAPPASPAPPAGPDTPAGQPPPPTPTANVDQPDAVPDPSTPAADADVDAAGLDSGTAGATADTSGSVADTSTAATETVPHDKIRGGFSRPHDAPTSGSIDWTGLDEPPDDAYGHGDDDVDPDHADLTALWDAGFDHLPTTRPTPPPAPAAGISPQNEPPPEDEATPPQHPNPSPATSGHRDAPPPEPAPPQPPRPPTRPRAEDSTTPTPVPAGPLPGPRRGVIDLQISLTTLIGLTNHPGELAGFGPVIADIARHIAAENPDLTWRYSVYDETGLLMSHGITRRRPTAHDTAYINARDRTCRAPGCRMPAHRCEIDHTNDWAKSRNTSRANLANLCSRHHHFKHLPDTDLIQLDDGILAWKTPLGQCLTTHPSTYFDN
ncbi:DUF222 domain-containing protein [Actinomycetes bacterium KLBMP 9797]